MSNVLEGKGASSAGEVARSGKAPGARKAKAPRPHIASANDLLLGDVVYLAEGYWTRALGEALVSSDFDVLKEAAQRAKQTRQVVDLAFVEVSNEGGRVPKPLMMREIIREHGPTCRPDLGRQAQQGRRLSSA